MSITIIKNGLITSSGEKINENLLGNSNIILTQNYNGDSHMSYTIPDISMISTGTHLTVSVYVEMHNVKSLRRAGIEPSFHKENYQTYLDDIYVGAWTTDFTDRKIRIYAKSTIYATIVGVGQHAIYIQGAEFNDGGYITLSYPKLEIGDVPTPWCPNKNDEMYTGNQGFIEHYLVDNNCKFYNNHLECNELIEI
jgi:hypothetical protein